MIELFTLPILVVMLASWFGPIQYIKELMHLDKFRYGWILSCPKCLGLWVGLIYHQDIFKAALTSLLAYGISHVIDRIELWYEK